MSHAQAPRPDRHPGGGGEGSGPGGLPNQALEKFVRRGIELFRSGREIAAGQLDPVAARERQMVEEHRMARSRYEVEVRRHAFRQASAKLAAGGSAALSALLALGIPADGLATADVASGGMAVGLGWAAYRFLRRSKELAKSPPVLALPPLPPARLRVGARGAQSAESVRVALLHLYDLIPKIARLHAEAGAELARAVSEAEPLLRGQVERLAALDRIEWDMPGSTPARAAAEGATLVAARLDNGAKALQELVAAAVHLLAAPDLVDGTAEILLPAIDSLQAYTYGLRQASQLRGPGY